MSTRKYLAPVVDAPQSRGSPRTTLDGTKRNPSGGTGRTEGVPGALWTELEQVALRHKPLPTGTGLWWDHLQSLTEQGNPVPVR